MKINNQSCLEMLNTDTGCKKSSGMETDGGGKSA